MADKKLRVFKLKAKKPEELASELEKCKEELSQLRVSKVAGSTATKLGKIKVFLK
jgi:ribosomal protein L29